MSGPRYLISNPCEDACGTLTTDRLVEGAPVYRCPGCDSEWIELDERTPTPTRESDAPVTAPVGPRDDVVRPHLLHTVLDAREIRPLAEFYRELLGLTYRPGDEPPADGPDDADWLVLTHPDGRRCLAFQRDPAHEAPTWPEPGVGQQLHLDLTVPDVDDLAAVHARVLALGGRELADRSDDPEEPLHVYADPAGHPFCVFVAQRG